MGTLIVIFFVVVFSNPVVDVRVLDFEPVSQPDYNAPFDWGLSETRSYHGYNKR